MRPDRKTERRPERVSVGDLGCCNIAAQIVLAAEFGLSAHEAFDRCPATFRELVSIAKMLWRVWDTPEALAERIRDQMPPEVRALPPFQVTRTDGKREGLQPPWAPSLFTRSGSSTPLPENALDAPREAA